MKTLQEQAAEQPYDSGGVQRRQRQELAFGSEDAVGNHVWFMSGITHTDGAFLDAVSDTKWKVVGSADFNADGKPDIVWRNSVSGEINLWLMNGTAHVSGAAIEGVPDTNWRVSGVGGFNP